MGIIALAISKSNEHEVQGWFEIMSSITPWIVRDKVQYHCKLVMSITNIGIKNVF